MSTHSPGPWVVVPNWEDEDVAIADATDHVVAYVWTGENPKHAADARLIEAAPELLEMARIVASGYVDVVNEAEARRLIARIEGDK